MARAGSVAALAPLDARFAGSAEVWARRLGLRAPDPSRCVPRWAAELRGDVAEAVAGWDAASAPYEAALALAFSPSSDDQVEALRRLDALGATAVAAVGATTAAQGGSSLASGCAEIHDPGHPAGLTSREQEVLQQLGHGLSNEEIAAHLFISTKTAGHHVSAVLGKLGVSGRREAVAEARRRGLLPASGQGTRPRR